MSLSPADLDYLVRTAYGEARGESPEGQAAVMQVVLNRLNSGKWGNDVKSVVTAPNQFEPWNKLPTKAALLALKPDSPDYQKIAQVAQNVTSGTMGDITNGATHFLSPAAQKAMGRNIPSWAQTPLAQVGNHMFFAPDGPVQRPGATPPEGGENPVMEKLNQPAMEEVTDPAILEKFNAQFGGERAADPLVAATLEGNIDTKTGAPVSVREAVGGAPTPLDAIRELRKSYPEAQPFGKDNYVFMNPETKQPTLYNEKNPRVFGIPMPTKGDVASVAREGFQMAGAGIGAALSTPPAVAGAPFTAGASLALPAAGAAGGSVVGDKSYDFLRAMLGRGDSRTSGQIVKDAAGTAALNGVTEGAGRLIPIAAKNIVTTTKNRAVEMAPDALQALSDKLGIKLSAGQVTGLPAVNFAERAAGNTLSGGGHMTDFFKNQVARSQGLLNEMSDTVTKGRGATNDSVGGALQQGVKDWREKVAQTTGQLSEKFWKDFRDPTTGLTEQVPLGNLWNVLTGDVNRLAKSGAANSAPSIASNKTLLKYMEQIGADLADNTTAKIQAAAQAAGKRVPSQPFLPKASTMAEGSNYPIEALSMLRTKIGDELAAKQGELFNSVGERQLQRMYGAISEDMKAAAKAKGPASMKAFDDLNRFYAAAANRSKTYLNQIATSKPEDVYNIAMAGAGKSGEQLRAIRRSVGPDQWNQLVGHTLDNLGKARAGAQNAAGDAFSVETMLTNWNKMSPEAKDVLFSNPANKELRSALDDLMQVGSAIKGSEKFINRSQTAGTLTAAAGTSGVAGLGALAGGLPGAAMAALGHEGTNFLTSRMLTSPKVVRFLAEAGRNANNPGMVSQGLARLTAAESDPGVRDFLNAYHKQKPQIKDGTLR